VWDPGGAEGPTGESAGLRRRKGPEHVRVTRRQDPLRSPTPKPPPTPCIFLDPRATYLKFLLHDITEEEW